MASDDFGAPIFVRRHKRHVEEIVSVRDAIDFLIDWTDTRHDMLAETVLRACFDVQAGTKPVAVVRDAFVKFAKRAGVWDEPETVMPWLTSNKQSSGRVPI
ncbi:DUF982 domain-containing protein [Aurantimonas sp. A3-2-R12]|uniref:DUF982 domain-containing protein n=1 Tax=Aurantimonas sp. A3-2-R12 TaxID=3114362 RepID=UPI002E189B7E|nr:DUF982 domain-containing protein [Aurantimonas sp. A3-2-R12]